MSAHNVMIMTFEMIMTYETRALAKKVGRA